MSETVSITPKWYWIGAIVFAIWAAMGVMIYLGYTMATPEELVEQMGPVYGEYAANQPAWHTAVFALAIFTGVAGAIGLLLRKGWAVLAYTASLIFILISEVKGFVLDGAGSFMSTGQVVTEIVVVLLGIGAFLFARKAKSMGILT